jgi:Zn-dependent metalloprotease/subtilisin-like proprotein convertase family protein
MCPLITSFFRFSFCSLLLGKGLFQTRHLCLILLLSLSSMGLIHAQNQTVFKGLAAEKMVPNSQLVRLDKQSLVPSFIKFSESSALQIADIQSIVREAFKVGEAYSLELMRVDKDQIGFEHYRYQQTFNGLPVEGNVLIAHVRNGRIETINGHISNNIQLSTAPGLTEAACLEKALLSVHADVYAWEVDDVRYKSITSPPVGVLEILDQNLTTKKQANYHLAYKFDVYAVSPLSRGYVFIDAHTGKVLRTFDRIHHEEIGDTLTTVTTVYSGPRTFTTYNTGNTGANKYQLKETGRNMETINLSTVAVYGDADNVWDTIQMGQNKYAIDCHWGTEKTYDFFFNTFGLDGYDGNGALITSYMNSDGAGPVNAFWDGFSLNYGSGDFEVDPLSTLDVVGHEFAHAVTEYSAGLIYADESGALNESFSDIFGAVIEFKSKPPFATGNWTNAEDAGTVFRNMANPNEQENPDTYGGLYWIDGADVHYNSAIQNLWFVLLTDGGTGTNDLTNDYEVVGIGLDKAAAIAYRNLVFYLTPDSDFEDASALSQQAAADLFPGCAGSLELKAVADAWYAVGVGSGGAPINLSSDFSGSFCTLPQTIQFEAMQGTTVVGIDSYVWDFGDGTTGTGINPTHTYTVEGDYTVTLEAVDCNGIVVTTEAIDYISIDTDGPCNFNMVPGEVTATNECQGNLFDTGGPNGDVEAYTESTFTISSTLGLPITLIVNSFSIDYYDAFMVYDGDDANATLLASYTFGTAFLPGTQFHSTGNSLTVYHASSYYGSPGFSLSWTNDGDGDGVGPASCNGTDCDDANPNVWLSCNTCVDTDGDGFYTGVCDAFVGGEDCDDTDTTINPVAIEFCNGIDDNCTGAEDNFPLDIVIIPIPVSDSCSGGLTLNTDLVQNITSNQIGGSISIPESGAGDPYPSTISATGGSTEGLMVSSVELIGLSHSYPGDIYIYLEAPDGTELYLMFYEGGGENISNVNYTFTDGAPNLDPYYSNPSGNYSSSSGFLADFTGNLNGTWRLYIYDDAGGDYGSLDSWKINFGTGDPYIFNWTSFPNNEVIPSVPDPIVHPEGSTTYTLTIETLGCTSTSSIQADIVPDVYYADTDGDNFGNIESTILNCFTPPGYVADSSDCDDSNAAIYPGATEIINNMDDNCNGIIDTDTLVATTELNGQLFTLYPNPATTLIKVSSLKNVLQAEARILDITGRLLSSHTLSESNPNIVIEHLPAGIYLIELKQDEYLVVKKWIKL